MLIRYDLRTALVMMDAPKFDLRKEVPSHPVHFVELRLISTERTRVRILSKPECFALTTYRLFTTLAFQRCLQNIITDSAD